jgi:phosphoserine phosphatase RsbU/P
MRSLQAHYNPEMASRNPTPRYPQPRSASGGFQHGLARFWQHVSDGMELSQLWTQFMSEARSGYRLYSREVEGRTAGTTRPRGRLETVKQFFWAILEKLSPARRVLLLLGIVLLLMGGGEYVASNAHGDTGRVAFDLHPLGGLILLLVLTMEIADRVVMKRDLEIAKEIQTWLLPATPPDVPGMKLAFGTRPANTVAGDFYDVFPRGEGKFLFVVADVVGKSIPAALLMATFQASLKTLSMTSGSLVALVDRLNEYACTCSQGGQRFTTAFLAEYTPASRKLVYINAGHNNPMLLRAAGPLERLDVGGLPLGIQAAAPYSAAEVTLAAQDWLVIFTDGLVEAVNERNEDFGEPRLLAELDSGVALAPSDLLRQVMGAVDRFTGTAPQHDDTTCLLARVG